MPKGVNVTDEVKQEIANRIAAGVDSKKLAREYKVSKSTIYKYAADSRRVSEPQTASPSSDVTVDQEIEMLTKQFIGEIQQLTIKKLTAKLLEK